MTTRDKLEYQKRLRFLREARAKTASEQLKLAKAAEESDLTKRVTTLGDKENRVPARGETPKAYNEVPKTRETSRVKKPLEAGDKGNNVLDIDLSDLDYAKISEQKRFYVKRVGREERNEPYGGPEMEELGIEPQFYSDEAEAGTVADMLIDKDPHGMEDFYVANLEDDPLDIEDDEETMSDEEFEEMLREATPPQEDADQSLSRMKKRKKATRTKNMKRKSHAKLNESNLVGVLRECGCEMESPFDAPEDEPQGYMLKQSLEKIGSQATDLSNLANHDDDPEPWVEFKVTSAAENIDAVHDYIKYGRKHRSDMSGHEDMHSHDDMMNENRLRRLIRKIILEQPINLATGLPAPTTTPVTPAPAASTAARPATAYRRGMSPEVTGAINEIFSTDPTSRSLMNHLTRMLRGIQQNNAGVADGELANNQPYVNNTLNRRIPLIKTQRPDLTAVADELAAQINTFNRPAFPRTLAQLTNKPQAIARIQALINWLRTNQNRFTAEPAPAPTPAPTPIPPVTDEQVNAARAEVQNIEQEFRALYESIRTGRRDIRREPARTQYMQELDNLALRRQGNLAIVYARGASSNPTAAAAQVRTRMQAITTQRASNQANIDRGQEMVTRMSGRAGYLQQFMHDYPMAGALTMGLAPSIYATATELAEPLATASPGLTSRLEGVTFRLFGHRAYERWLYNELSVLSCLAAQLENPGSNPSNVTLPSSRTVPGPRIGVAGETTASTPAPTTSPAPEPSSESTPRRLPATGLYSPTLANIFSGGIGGGIAAAGGVGSRMVTEKKLNRKK